jgi:ADP-ribosylglycohydrolase
LGGDSDTIACMTGGIAQAYYQAIPPHMLNRTRLLLDPALKQVIDTFNTEYSITF